MKKRYACRKCNTHISLDNDNPWRPFCSERCKMIDLGEWIEGNNRIISAQSEFPDLPARLQDDTHH